MFNSCVYKDEESANSGFIVVAYGWRTIGNKHVHVVVPNGRRNMPIRSEVEPFLFEACDWAHFASPFSPALGIIYGRFLPNLVVILMTPLGRLSVTMMGDHTTKLAASAGQTSPPPYFDSERNGCTIFVTTSSRPCICCVVLRWSALYGIQTDRTEQLALLGR